MLTLGVLGTLGFIGFSFYERAQEDRSLFEVVEDTGPRTWTMEELDPFVRLDSVAELRYTNYVTNAYRADDSARGTKSRLENELAMSEMREHCFKTILINCNGAVTIHARRSWRLYARQSVKCPAWTSHA